MELALQQEKAKQLRADIVKMTYLAKSGHPGGSLSCVEMLMALYYNIMKVDPSNPGWEERDRFVLSKGHACPALYAVLADKGYFPREDLWTLRKFHSHLQGHPDMRKTPGVDANTGSLGQGVSIAGGMALAAKYKGESHRVFVITGDGESQEGLVWEAAMSAAHYKLDNLTVLLDHNGLQIDGTNDGRGRYDGQIRGFRLRVRKSGRPRHRRRCGGGEHAAPGQAAVCLLRNAQGPRRVLHGRPGGLARQGAEQGAV